MRYIDFYLKNKKMKNFDEELVEVRSYEEVILNKVQLIIFTNKGEILGNPDFGCDIPNYLWQTHLQAEAIENEINAQLITYIPEIVNINYKVSFLIVPGTIQDVGILTVDLDFTNISAVFK